MSTLRSRLAFKLSMMILTILILLSSALFYLQIRNTKQASEEAIGSFAMHVAEACAGQFDTAAYGEFLQDPQESDLYWRIRDQLNQYRLQIGALYVYTVKFDDREQPVLLIDGQPKDDDSASPIGEITDVPKASVERLLSGESDKTGIMHNPDYGNYISSYAPLRDAAGKVIGALGIDTDVSVSNTIYREVVGRSVPLFIAMAALTLVVFALIAWFLARVLRPLGVIVGGAEAIARGDLAEAQRRLGATRVRSKDEIGLAYAAMTRMNERLGVALGDVVRDVRRTTQELLGAAERFGAEAARMVDSNERLGQSTEALADGARHQRTGAEESARSMEEIALAIQRVAESSASVSGASADALGTAEQGRGSIRRLREQVVSMAGVADRTMQSVQVLGGYMDEIGPALQSVARVADQTKILALNASIEAVRAGEHGAGFAVVAGEVRKLAEASAASVARITSLLEQVQREAAAIGARMAEEAGEMARGGELSEQAEALFNQTADRFVFVDRHIQEISAAAEQMLAGSEEVAASVEQMSQISAATSEGADVIRSMSADQLEAAKRIAETTAQLRQRGTALEAAVEQFKL